MTHAYNEEYLDDAMKNLGDMIDYAVNSCGYEADESKFVESADLIIERHKIQRKTKLQMIRKARGFTQQELSEVSGVTLRMIQLYEQRQNDINKAQVNVVVSLARALGCAVEDLLE